MLHRYWFTFVTTETPSVLHLGCGVTAKDIVDAKSLLESVVFPLLGRRELLNVIEDVDISTLEEDHVRPNMASPMTRGVWFPLINSDVIRPATEEP